jgi:hypothetical protein
MKREPIDWLISALCDCSKERALRANRTKHGGQRLQYCSRIFMMRRTKLPDRALGFVA